MLISGGAAAADGPLALDKLYGHRGVLRSPVGLNSGHTHAAAVGAHYGGGTPWRAFSVQKFGIGAG